MKIPSGLKLDSPAWPLLEAGISYWGVTTANGAGTGLTIVDAGLLNEPNYSGHMAKVLVPGATAGGQAMRIATHIGNTLTVAYPFTDPAGAPWPVVAGTPFVVLSDSWGLDIAAILALPIFLEQAATPVNINAVAAGWANVFSLAVAGTRYIVRSLRLKCANPNPDTVRVALYELVNGALILVDFFDITAANFADYHSLMDMFGLPHLAGDQLQVSVRVITVGPGPYAVTGEYSWARTV